MGHLNIVKSLLQRGASPNASNVVRTVYHLRYTEQSNPQAAAFLLYKLANVFSSDYGSNHSFLLKTKCL